jgi:hypothetical protein
MSVSANSILRCAWCFFMGLDACPHFQETGTVPNSGKRGQVNRISHSEETYFRIRAFYEV